MDHLATASLTSLWDEVSGIQPDPDHGLPGQQ